MPESPKAYTISAITRIIKSSLEDQFSDIWLEGEISNYHHHSSGHRYITLKDEGAVIKVVMWRNTGDKLKFEPENGQTVLAYGDITVYPKGGNYQLNCRKLLPVGVGPLELAFRQLHEKLDREGLFDQDRKQELPLYPTRIGVVTSPTSAAVRDVIQVSQRRNRTVELIIYPAQVQGDGAEETIAAGISYFNTRNDIDLIIICRGGGSLEDIWPFNTEVVVRAIAASELPVVSGVGHEIDTTLADLAADYRAPTPSAAAEISVWLLDDLKSQIKQHMIAQASQVQFLVSAARDRLRSFLNRAVFSRPENMINQRRQYLDNLSRLMLSEGKNRFETHKNRLSSVLSKLEALSPMKVLARGYSITRRESDNFVVTRIDDVGAEDILGITVTDGLIITRVEKVVKTQGRRV